MYKVYVKTNKTGIITAINSDTFLPDTKGWTLIDEGDGDKYHHAQGNYLPSPLMTDDGVYRWKLMDDKAVERTAEEIQADIDAIPPPPPTAEEKVQQAEMKLTALKPLMTELVKGKPADIVIQTADFILPWKEGDYKLDDVCLWEGQPRRCCQAHDSTGNPTWTPAMASLWAPYHGTTPETALPWIAPTGAQDIYKKGEWMVWTDGATYECLSDTNYSPDDYAQAWRKYVAEDMSADEGASDPIPDPEEPDPTPGEPEEPTPEEPTPGEPEPETNSNGTAVWSEWVPWNNYNETLYQIGDRVTKDGVRYIATLGNNHYDPVLGTGWKVVIE